MSPYLIDQFVDRERIRALRIMCVAYKSSNISVRFVAEELGWTGPSGLDDCVHQLEEWKISIVPVTAAADDMDLEDQEPKFSIDIKESSRVLNEMWATKVGRFGGGACNLLLTPATPTVQGG